MLTRVLAKARASKGAHTLVSCSIEATRGMVRREPLDSTIIAREQHGARKPCTHTHTQKKMSVHLHLRDRKKLKFKKTNEKVEINSARIDKVKAAALDRDQSTYRRNWIACQRLNRPVKTAPELTRQGNTLVEKQLCATPLPPPPVCPSASPSGLGGSSKVSPPPSQHHAAFRPEKKKEAKSLSLPFHLLARLHNWLYPRLRQRLPCFGTTVFSTDTVCLSSHRVEHRERFALSPPPQQPAGGLRQETKAGEDDERGHDGNSQHGPPLAACVT